MSKSGVRRVILLTLGWEDLPKTVSIYGDTSGERLREPVPAVLLGTEGGWVLLDTGLNPALVRDAPLYRRFHGHGVEALLPPGPGDPLKGALEMAGVALEDITAVALSHLDGDHAGGVRHFTQLEVPVHLQRKELEYGMSGHPGPEEHGMFRIDYDDPAINWRLADGEVEIAPGVTAVPSPGHTPGHQSFIVDVDEAAGGGGFVFAFDAADLTENVEHELPVGSFINCAAADTIEPIRHLKALARERGYPVVPGHDPAAWPALTAQLSERWPARV
ncbi:MAG TPA: N-acyl homoserine lactonase family protein [Acidimicrobiales bacterium]|nr:N-acyl homoserine lactonase family protein [Acidimicrobiales bacterium]